MRALYIISFFLVCLVISLGSCKKPENSFDKGCGCVTDSIINSVTYTSFNSFNYNGVLFYDSAQGLNAWFIGITIPNSNKQALLKICNTNLPTVTALINQGGAAVKVAGKLKKLCPDENFGFQLPETGSYYITIDSLKKQ